MSKYKYLVGLTLCLITFIDCSKESIDHRNKYLGWWEFKVKRTELNTDSIGYYHHDSLTYIGQIKTGSSKDDIYIEYSMENSITLKINEENDLYDFPNHYCSGEFQGNDHLHLFLRWGGLGGGTTHTVNGEKL